MRILVDTNVLVRSVQREHPRMRTARQALRSFAVRGNELCVTPQNITEFWNVCTRPVDVNGLGYSIAMADRLTSKIEQLFTVLPEISEIFARWRELVVQYAVRGAKVHDTRLIASMHVHGLQHILTFNDADFRRYTEVTVLQPGSVLP